MRSSSTPAAPQRKEPRPPPASSPARSPQRLRLAPRPTPRAFPTPRPSPRPACCPPLPTARRGRTPGGLFPCPHRARRRRLRSSPCLTPPPRGRVSLATLRSPSAKDPDAGLCSAAIQPEPAALRTQPAIARAPPKARSKLQPPRDRVSFRGAACRGARPPGSPCAARGLSRVGAHGAEDAGLRAPGCGTPASPGQRPLPQLRVAGRLLLRAPQGPALDVPGAVRRSADAPRQPQQRR